MTVADVRTDREAKTLTIAATFPATVDRVWQMWADPRLLERWWGPPTYPATVVDHDLTPGGRVRYYMTGPEGDRYHGWWRVLSLDPPRALEFEDGFADAEGNADAALPVTRARVTVTAEPDGSTRMTVESTFPSVEAMDQLLEMGAREGMVSAIEQIDALLDERG